MKAYIILAALPVLIVSFLAINFVSAHDWFKLSPEDAAERKSVMFEQKAALLGISVEEMKNAWAEGKNFHELTEEFGLTHEELKLRMKEKMEARMAEHLQALVDEEVITQEQADQRSETVGEGKGFKRGFPHGFGHHWQK